jgi:hypothetical protein
VLDPTFQRRWFDSLNSAEERHAFPAHARVLTRAEGGIRRAAFATGPCRCPKIHGRFLRCVNFLPQNCAVCRQTVQISIYRVASEKPAAQRHEKLRKKSLGN